MRKMRLFIFGSGTSVGTLGRPAVEQFGERLATLEPQWVTRYPELAQAVRDLPSFSPTRPNAWRLDEAWTRLDYYAKLSSALGVGDYGGDASTQIHAAVAIVYGRLDLVAADMGLESQDFSLRQILDTAQVGDVIVSFNWDTLVERAADLLLGARQVPFLQSPYPDCPQAVALAKPHGSLSWHRVPAFLGPPRAYGPRGTPVLDPIPSSEILEGKREPLLLGAVPIKSELIREVQRANGIYECIMLQWRTLCDAMARADDVVVAGYGFPPEDQYGRFLLQEAARRRPARIRALELWMLREANAGVIRNILEVLGPNQQPERIEIRGPIVAPQSLINRNLMLRG
jgi:hypothetical protein